jgi:hypothetical protein
MDLFATEKTLAISPVVKDVVVSLFDKTGNMIKPWLDAGFTCYIIDIQHKDGYHADKENPRLIRVGADIRSGWLPPRELVGRVAFTAAFPPCDHLAVSGSRWFKGKGLRKLSLAIDLFATAAETCEWLGAPYLIENPVSTISSYWRKPDHTFDPFEYAGLEPGDNYTKRTCLWVGGGFVMPLEVRGVDLPAPDKTRIHHASPGADRANFRSMTPMGFARAVYSANAPQPVQVVRSV